MLDIHLSVWLISAAVVLGLVIFDFYAHVRTPHAPTFKESAIWSAVYIALAIIFGIVFLIVVGPEHGGEFFAGYITEKSLSVDNLFVFLLIMTSFRVPRENQQKVLLVGVALALVMRTAFILLGAAALNAWSWVFYLFGAILLWTAWKQVKPETEHEDKVPGGAVVALFKKVVPTVDEYNSDRLTVKKNGKRFLTPMFLVMVAIGFTDLLFALDSIPAIYGLTQEPYVVFMANALALLGLRQLYFLIGGLLDRLVYLAQGLGVILAFIGFKLIFHAMHVNELSFINGGKHIEWAPEIGIATSLTVIIGTLAVVTVASLWKTRRDAERGILDSDGRPDLPEPDRADEPAVAAADAAVAEKPGGSSQAHES
ncbi:TerC family protein [Flavimobilis rhizosphaerae]|uniref:TerC family protein n=1 Tax=Flavimobilis rhizosphaerae TaxID=2775421 RepID=UPI002E283B3D|nr:TerC family protein [Flavimobilis rhizosphaerae]